MKVSVIAGCYNEKENVHRFIESVSGEMRELGQDFEVVIIDESTDPETLRTISRDEGSFSHLKTLKNIDRKGLLRSQVQGINVAKGSIKIVMDCDMQHNPRYLKNIIESFDEGTEIIVMSRYIDGGRNGDKLTRKTISLCGRMICWILLPHSRKLSDPNSGYFAIKNLEFLPSLDVKGEKSLMYILSLHPEMRIKEIPYTFERRKYGRSKLMTFSVITSFIKEVIVYRHLFNSTRRDGSEIKYFNEFHRFKN